MPEIITLLPGSLFGVDGSLHRRVECVCDIVYGGFLWSGVDGRTDNRLAGRPPWYLLPSRLEEALEGGITALHRNIVTNRRMLFHPTAFAKQRVPHPKGQRTSAVRRPPMARSHRLHVKSLRRRLLRARAAARFRFQPFRPWPIHLPAATLPTAAMTGAERRGAPGPSRVCILLLVLAARAQCSSSSMLQAAANAGNGGAAVLDVTLFETQLLPRWLAQYQLPGVGNYSFQPHNQHPHPYAASDVLHVLCFTGQMNLSEADKDQFASAINAFQHADGFFDVGTPSGGSMWHAAGYVTAGLSLIDRFPALPNVMFDRIAATPSLWAQTVDALLDEDVTPAPSNITSGCSEGYSCAQNIASLVAWQILTNGSHAHGGGMVKYAKFVSWYLQHLTAQADSRSGLWCTEAQRKKHGEINCIGGSFHIDFVFQFLSLHPEYIAKGDSARFPFPTQQLNASLSL